MDSKKREELEQRATLMLLRLIQENENTSFLNQATIEAIERKYKFRMERKEDGK